MWFPAAIKVGSQENLELTDTKVKKSWLITVHPEGKFVCQDGAPGHTSSVVQQLLRGNLPAFCDKEMWPPQSPDLNPLDFEIWGAVVRKVCHERGLWSKDSWRSRLDKCMEANGSILKKKSIYFAVLSFKAKVIEIWSPKLQFC